jgi:hypothetical protein
MNIASLATFRRTSRRHFVQTTATVVGAGSLVGTGLWRPALAASTKSRDPRPIPDGSPLLGGAFHVYGPGLPNFDPPDSEPATVTDFKGFVGLGYISGTVVRTHSKTGDKVTLPFQFADMRFMQGVYRATDGRVHQGTFALI